MQPHRQALAWARLAGRAIVAIAAKAAIRLVRAPTAVWSVGRVYDTILSTPQSVERWLDELTRTGLLEKLSEPVPGYRCCTDPGLLAQMAEVAESYRTRPVRLIETIYQPKPDAAQSFADAFKFKPPKQES